MLRVLVFIALFFQMGCANLNPQNSRIELAERLVKSVPMVICGEKTGSGILFLNKGKPMVLTAAHIIKCDIISPLKEQTASQPQFVDIHIAGWSVAEDSVEWVCRAEILHIDYEIDFAILELSSANQDMRFARFSSTQPRFGEKIFMIGSPDLDASTLSEGIISHPSRNPNVNNPGHIKYIHTDAKGFSGSSGGGIFREEDGTCIGMVVMRNPNYHAIYAVPITTILNQCNKNGTLLDIE